MAAEATGDEGGLAAAAEGALRAAGVLPEGWSVRVDGRVGAFAVRLEVVAAPREGGPAAGAPAGERALLVWAEPAGAPFRAFRAGPRYATAYERAEGLGPREKDVLLAACAALAALEQGPSLREAAGPARDPGAGGAEAAGARVPLRLGALVDALAPWVGLGRPLVDGWTPVALEQPAPHEVHLVLAHRDVPWLPRMVIAADEAGRPLVRYALRAGKHRPASLGHHQRLLADALGDLLAHAGARGPVRLAPDPDAPPARRAVPLPEADWPPADPLLGRARAAFRAEVARAWGAELPALVDMDGLYRRLEAAWPGLGWERWAVVAALQEGLVVEAFDRPGAPLEPVAVRALLGVLVGRFGARPALAAEVVALLAEALDRPGTGPVVAAEVARFREAPSLGPVEPRHPDRPAPPTLGPDGLVRVPAGAFVMGREEPLVHAGSVLGRHGLLVTHRPHRVTLTGDLLVGAGPVTQADWQRVAGALPEDLTFRHPALPVHGISWLEAVRFCNAASRAEGLAPAYAVDGAGRVAWPDRAAPGYRLLTEAEWEHACRAGRGGLLAPGGPAEATYDATWEQDGARWAAGPTPVGTHPASPWGLHDMQGNVWELVWDRPGPGRSAPAVDPVGREEGPLVAACGGAWTSWRARLCEPSARILLGVGARGYDIGFRVARRAP